MDLQTTDATATSAEKGAVDAVAGPPASGWEGGVRASADYHVALGGGFHDAEARRDLLLPALQSVQTQIGWISPGAVNYLAQRLTVPPAEAFGVASFYSLLATDEQAPRVIHVCDDIACAPAGAEDLVRGIEAATADDDTVIVKRSPCLGQCDRAPAAMLQIAGVGETAVAPADPELLAVAATGPSASSTDRAVTGDGGHRRLLRRVGRTDPSSLGAYRESGGYAALAKAAEMGPAAVLGEVKKSHIRGRGGAAFPMGVKWEAVTDSSDQRFLVCNADESEPGTFKDRVLLEDDPFAVVESMTIAGLAVGATRGFVYIRGEYPLGRQQIDAAAAQARAVGLLGDDIMGTGQSFDLEVRSGAGAYICGEETALFNSIEGFRGEPRNKPPFPTQAGLFGMPTVVNNVETLANVQSIVLDGGEAFSQIGTEDSTGPKLFCLSGAVANPGVYEVEFGATLGEVIDLAGGTEGAIDAILLGGAAGSFVRPDILDLPLTFEDTREAGVSLGSGVIMPFAAGTNFEVVVQRIAEFFRDESCGQCVPCRVGTVRQEEALLRLSSGEVIGSRSIELALLDDINRVMTDASICGLGQTAGTAVQSAVQLGLIGGGG